MPSVISIPQVTFVPYIYKNFEIREIAFQMLLKRFPTEEFKKFGTRGIFIPVFPRDPCLNSCILCNTYATGGTRYRAGT